MTALLIALFNHMGGGHRKSDDMSGHATAQKTRSPCPAPRRR